MSEEKKFKPVVLPENVPVNYEFEKMLKGFLKQVQKEGKLDEVKKRKYYIKPSEIKRAEEKERRRKNR
jgi:ribosomal protein S21